MPLLVELDFETKSRCDLKVAGAWAYAEHESTEVLCLVYWLSGWDEPRVWVPWVPDAILKAPWYTTYHSRLDQLAANPDTIFVAHGAQFERAVWQRQMVEKHGLPSIPVERWECSQAACAWKVIPLALERGAQVLGLEAQKDMEGRKLTLSMSKPITKKDWMTEYPGPEAGTKKEWAAKWPADTLPEVTPDRLDRIIQYCATDVATEHAMIERVGLLSQQSANERKIWIYDQKINQRGITIDLDFVAAAEAVVEGAKGPLLEEFRELTGGINPGQVAKLTEWCAGQGVELDSLQKGYLEQLFGVEEADDDELPISTDVPNLPAGVRRVLQIRQMLGSASIKKLARMRACVCRDGRARGLLQYHAAGPGRWGGRLLQPQNFPRGAGLKKNKVSPVDAVQAIMTRNWECVEFLTGLPAIEAVASSLRFALRAADGHVFEVGDYSGIEARIVLALAGQYDKCALMASGHDVYFDMAEDIYGMPKGTWAVTDKALLEVYKERYLEERQTGKNTVLGCGFQMGADKFHDRYCQDQPPDFAEQVIQAYRKVWAPKVPTLWYTLDDAALEAVKTGMAIRADPYGITYQVEGDWLTARLPSGWQKLWYFQPALEWDAAFGRQCWTYYTMKMGKWTKVKAYGGLLTENAVQALARGLLCAAIDRLERAGHPVVLTVHDEVVCEVPKEKADQKVFEELMATRPLWAEAMQIPIAVEGWSGERYRK